MSSTEYERDRYYVEDEDGSSTGWPAFVAIFLVIAGTLNIIWGITALDNKHFFHESSVLWTHLNTWGWIAIIIGAIQVAGSALVASRHASGAVIAGFLAFCGIMLNFLSLGAYPVWSVILIVADTMVLWAVTVHGDAFVN